MFRRDLGYRYIGSLHDREDNKNIIQEHLTSWLQKQGISNTLITGVIRQLESAAALNDSTKLYYANQAVYKLLRYGVKEREGAGEQNQTVWLIDWQNPETNYFAIAEEVSIKGTNKKRPDLVLYVNGIALGVIELKRASVNVVEGIRQHLDNQKKEFIQNFFTTAQLLMAGNDTQGLRYGTIETPEKYYLEWKEDAPNPYQHRLDYHLSRICSKQRFLEIIHDFIVYDSGVKKTCRHNQFFGIHAARQHIARRQGGIIWHTQGSGKSLTMVWLAKWIRENVDDSRVLIITDRTELDDQIKNVFMGVEEDIYRTRSGADLIDKLNKSEHWLLCSLIHKFGASSETEQEAAAGAYIEEIKKATASNFKAKGDLFVFVDECHRTQSGILHGAMKAILPNAMFIGFTGTPLLKKDKQKSVEIFGPYIHTYKFDEAVADGVVLDLRYEARDIDQHITSPEKIDAWFEAKTRGLNNNAKSRLKMKWGTLQRVLSSKSRLEQIVNDIMYDMETRPRLMDGRGNAMLVSASVHEACTFYSLFCDKGLTGKVAIVTSFQPTAASIKGEETGEGLTEKLLKYNTYRKMLADHFGQSEEIAATRVDEFEQQVKERFIKEPGQMKLLIVVDKLLTGFDAPPATYLYINKQMSDHNLFQAICRVNRLDGDDKEYGYIIDYKDLFNSLGKAIADYTREAFAAYDAEDVKNFLKNRLQEGRQDLDNALEMVRALCEKVAAPRATEDYIHYFCGESGADQINQTEKEALRLSLYKNTASLLRAYADIASEMTEAGYTESEARNIREEVAHYEKVSQEIKLASGDLLDMKSLEPAMRHLLDSYIRADDSRVLVNFEELGLIELIVKKGLTVIESLPDDIRRSETATAETIENNVRKIIVDENPVNPKYYERMSQLLDELIRQRKQNAISYQKYLEEIKELSAKVLQQEATTASYPATINTKARQALYDNLDHNEQLAAAVDEAIRDTKKADWIGNRIKEKEIRNAIKEKIEGYEIDLEKVMELARAQKDYQ